MQSSWKQRISQHDMLIHGALTHPFESVHIGNGDIGASVNIFPHEIKIMLAKSDVWDARSDVNPEKYALKHDDLIKLVREKDKNLYCVWDVGEEKADYIIDCHETGNEHSYRPMPKRAGCVRLYHPGLSNTRVETRVRLIDGVLETEFYFSKGKLIVRVFVEKGNNRFWMQIESVGETPWFILNVEKEPDDWDITVPRPVMQQEKDRLTTISQMIPAGFGIDEFNWVLAAAFPNYAPGVEAQYLEHEAWRVRQYCSLQPGCMAELCVAIATDRDGAGRSKSEHQDLELLAHATGAGVGDTRTRAMALATEHLPFSEIFAAHQALWEQYWSTSNIALSDPELESVWYRNHFGYGCAMSRNMTPLGSGGNVIIRDSIPWNGDYHMNHNFQKWYCTALPTNHPEWIELYADFIADKLPMFEYQAKLIFGLDGAFCDISYFPFMAKEKCNIINYMGRALAVTGWVGQPLWQHWEYMRDIDWLRERAYPYIKRAAQFYYNYMKKYSNEEGEIFPSIRLEEPGWQKNFVGNRNVISDLCMFKKAFDRAIDAASILGVDEEWRTKWSAARSRVPAIDHGIDENGDGWISLDKQWPEVETRRRSDESRYSRWAGGGWIVYPGEYVMGDGDDTLTEALRDMMRKTDLMNPFVSRITGENMYPGVPIIHPISSLVPSIRLGVLEHFETIKQVLLAHRLTYGQTCSYMLSGGEIPKEVNSSMGYLWYDWRSVENKYAGVFATTEMLLQSQGGIIRLFPFIPDGMDASFNGFRATGGFVIFAECVNGGVHAAIKSEAGETVRLKTEATAVSVTCGGTDVPCSFEQNLICFNTQAGMEYVLKLGVEFF